MKNRNVLQVIILLVLIAFCTGLNASDSSDRAKKVMRKYKREEGFFGMSIPASLVRLMIPKEEAEVKEFMKDIRKIRFLVYDDNPSGSVIVKSCKKDLDALFRDGEYIDLLTVTDKSETVKIMAIPDGDCLKDLVIFVSNTEELVVVNLVGTLDMNKIMSLVENTKKDKTQDSILKI